MGKRSRIALALLLVAGLGWLGWQVLRPREPVYQGRTLSSWLSDFEDWDGDTNSTAAVAFRQMGTNALTPLLQIIQSKPSRFQRILMRWNASQRVIKLPFAEPWRQTTAASFALYAMGLEARPALPALTNLLFHTNASIVAATALAGIGRDAIPPLIVALTNQDRSIRMAAASGLAWEHSDPDIVVRALIARLADKDLLVQIEAASSLGVLQAKPEIVVPALIQSFASNDATLRGTIVVALGLFEGKAKESVPMVLEALKDPDESVRDFATNALKKIDPEAAARVGIK